jgi:hypothetical protein
VKIDQFNWKRPIIASANNASHVHVQLSTTSTNCENEKKDEGKSEEKTLNS